MREIENHAFLKGFQTQVTEQGVLQRQFLVSVLVLAYTSLII